MTRIWIFLCLTVKAWRHWFTDKPTDKYYDERNSMAIDPRFAWTIAGILVHFADELSQWEELK